MWWMVAAAAAGALLGGAGASQQYKSDLKAAEWNIKYQKYRNAMTNIANAQNQNAITTNTSLAIQYSALKAINIQADAIGDRGRSVVAAAAAGVGGNSVAATIADMDRAAANAEYARREELNTQFLGFDQQRRSSAMSAAQQQDYSYIPLPDKSSITMGFLKGAMQGAQFGKSMGAGWGTGSDGGTPPASTGNTGFSNFGLSKSGQYYG
jgi:hypothetical protein